MNPICLLGKLTSSPRTSGPLCHHYRSVCSPLAVAQARLARRGKAPVCVLSIESLCSCTQSSQSWPRSVVTLEYPSTHALKSSGVAFIEDLVYNAPSESSPCIVLCMWLSSEIEGL